MADTKLSALTEVTTLDDTDELYVNDAGVSKRITKANLETALRITDAEVKTAYENNADTNAFTDADETKLDGIEAGAEVNTSSNVGTAGVGVFKQKTGVDFEFKKINAGSSKVTITDDTGNDEIDIDVDQTAIDHDLLLNFSASEHFTEASIDHTAITNVGTNTHAQIDTHIADASDPHGATLTQTNITSTGVIDFGGASSFELPNGAAPTVDATGEMAFDTTDNHLIMFDGTAARVIGRTFETVDIWIESPEAADAIKFIKVPADAAITLKRMYYYCDAATNCVFNIEERTTPTGAGTDIHSSDFTATTTEANTTTFSNGAIDAGDYLYIAVTSVSGTPGGLGITLEYYVDVE